MKKHLTQSRSTSIPDFSSDINQTTPAGLLTAFYILTLPLTMFTLGNLGSPIRLINVAVIGISTYLLFKKRYLITWGAERILWGLSGAWLLITVIWSPIQEKSFTFVIGYVFLIVTFLSLSLLPFSKKDFKVVNIAWLLMAAFAGSLFLIFGEKAEFGDRTHLVLPSGGSDPNEFSGYFLFPLAILVNNTLSKKGLTQLFSLAGALACLYVVLMTGSRAGLIACLVVLVLVILRKIIQAPIMILTASAFILIGYFATLNFIWPLIPEAVRERLSVEALVEDGGSSRDIIWKETLDKSSDSIIDLLFGFGPYGAFEGNIAIHNHFLQTFSDAGLVGFVILILFLLTVIYGSFQNPVVFASIIGVLIMMMTLTSYSNFRVAWAVIFMGLLFSRKEILAAS